MTVDDEGIGLLSCAGAILLFAFFSLPTKTHELGDGVAFQLFMCLGIWSVGCGVLLSQCMGSGGCPPLSPLAALGGAIWCLSNVLLTSIVKCIGVGPAMLQWGLIECLTGWATAKWGLFGLVAEPVRNAAENDGGVALVVLSLAMLAGVQPAVSDGSDKVPVAAINDLDAEEGARAVSEPTTGLLASINDEGSAVEGNSAIIASPTSWETSGYDFTHALSPLQRRIFGFGACIVAGALSGSTFTPPQLAVDRSGGKLTLLDLLFSHFCGILATSALVFVAYAAATRGRPWVSRPTLLPSFAAGLCWGLACTCWFLTNERLSIVIAFPLVTIGPGVGTMLIGFAFFREVQGWRNIALMAAALLVYAAGAVLIAWSGGAGS